MKRPATTCARLRGPQGRLLRPEQGGAGRPQQRAHVQRSASGRSRGPAPGRARLPARLEARGPARPRQAGGGRHARPGGGNVQGLVRLRLLPGPSASGKSRHHRAAPQARGGAAVGGTRRTGRGPCFREVMPPRRNEKYKLPLALPEGKVLDDTEGKQWVLGKKIGSGGFGLIYLAFPTNEPDKDARHVIKVEYQENGPLFSELKFYQRAAKKDFIKKWIKLKQLDYLGIPLFYGSGLTEFEGRSYRFMVMERLGIDLQKISDQNGTFKKSTVLQLGIRMLDILEYIHENEYFHGDIKAANLLLGYKNPDRVYLADYGLSYRYCPNGNHKQYQENPRKGHNGTMEFTSLDAHKGVALSRRSDLEILGYCLLRWLCGKLPWEKNLKDPVAVQTAKTNLLDELPESVLKWAPSGSSCCEIAQYLTCAHNLAYDEKPNYEMLKKILNPSGIPLGPLEFSTEGESVNVPAPNSQKVDSQMAATKQVNQNQNRLLEKKVHSERSAESCATRRKVQKEEKKLIGLLNKERAQGSIRRRQISSCIQSPNSFYEPHQDFTSPDIFNKSKRPSSYKGTSTIGMEVTEKSTGFGLAIPQFTLHGDTRADVYYYGFTILFLLMLICLALYFL